MSLTIEEGVTGIIGPNGAGKTTLIKIILGLIKPSRGVVRVFGEDPWVKGKSVRRRIGVLHEKPSFPGWATGYNFLKFVAELRGIEKPGLEAEKVLGLVGLLDAKDRKIREYSAGMVQRLGIAQAIIGFPELIILDEPTANLDPDGRLEVLETIKKIREKNDASFLISTHILPELERVCEFLVIMENGKIMDSGGVEELASKYYAYSLTIKCEEPLKLMEWASSQSIVKDIILRGNSVTLRTSDIKHLMNELHKLPSIAETLHVREEPGLLERIYSETTRRSG